MAYTRQSDRAIVTGLTLEPADLNAEFNAIVTAIGATQPLDATLTALAGLNTSAGFVVQTAEDAFTKRTLQAPAAGLTITNPAGTAGNPTFALANDLSALEGLASTGLAARTGSDAWAQRTITGTANEITLTNGSGAAGNPTVSLPSALTFTGKTITGGTYTSGAFNGTLGATTPSTMAGTTLALSGNLTYSGSLLGIQADTSDASDTKGAYLAGGGAASPSRGGYVLVYGNEHATQPGDVFIVAGSSPGARIDLIGNTLVDGLLTVDDGQIAFPASQNASADANTLDDYEEGTWTPTVTSSAGTITAYTSSGNYTKIGNRYFFTAIATITTNGTGSGFLQITLPATANNASAANGLKSTGEAVVGSINAATAVMNVFKYNATYPVGSGEFVRLSGHFDV